MEGKKEAAHKYIYKVREDPEMENKKENFRLEAYIVKKNGKTSCEILYAGSKEQCTKLLDEVHSEKLTNEQIKELYARTENTELEKDTFRIYQLKRGDDIRELQFESYECLKESG
ncbi:hypothetical protein [uncultured Megasphaera sp.]|uniref:hypothetical protein n=1 Tax=uncultured Megasphaera sp. TaxID=165188 RepID=UPI00288953B2|nr:hypothetical protein [uncultured Megasphaera sp.]